MTIFREEVASALAGFHASPVSWWTGICSVGFLQKEEKPKTQRKTFVAGREPTTHSTYTWHHAKIESS